MGLELALKESEGFCRVRDFEFDVTEIHLSFPSTRPIQQTMRMGRRSVSGTNSAKRQIAS